MHSEVRLQRFFILRHCVLFLYQYVPTNFGDYAGAYTGVGVDDIDVDGGKSGGGVFGHCGIAAFLEGVIIMDNLL